MDDSKKVVRLILSAMGVLAGLQSAVLSALPEPSGLASTGAIRRTFGLKLMGFEANSGQAGADVRFLLTGEKYRLLLGPQAITLVGRGPEGRWVRMRMDLIHANPHARIEGRDQLPGHVNYFRGNDSSRWITGVRRYASVIYRNVYPGIDLVFHFSNVGVEYDWIVAPGASPELIQIAFGGGGSLSVSEDGRLIARSDGQELVSGAPVAYQVIHDGHHRIKARYYLDGRRVGLRASGYDRRKALTIDPVLAYSTVFGGSGAFVDEEGVQPDAGDSIAVDSLGNAYITGVAYSQNFPAINSALVPAAGATNCFEAKLDPSGSPVYISFVGPVLQEACAGAVDAQGSAYITGGAQSGFPIVNPPSASGGSGAFVAKLSADGTRLLYSGILGSGVDTGFGVALDTAGNAYVAGVTGSPSNFPTTPGAVDLVLPGAQQAVFVAKISGDGSKLLYSVLLAGTGIFNEPAAVQVDASGSAFVAGNTNSVDFPTTSGAVETSPPGGAFVFKLNPSGSALIYSTYVGGPHGGDVEALSIDAAGNAYVAGYTPYSDFPTTPGAFQTTAQFDPSFAVKGFVTKLNASGSAVVYSTFLGGSDQENVSGITVDVSGNAYLTGETNSTDFPLQNPIQAGIGDGICEAFYMGPLIRCFDAFVTELNSEGSGLLFSTYFGGSGKDSGYGIATSGSRIYITGVSSSSDIPVTGSVDRPEGTVLAAAIEEGGNAPVFIPASVTNGASFLPGITPGAIATIFGQNLTSVSGIVNGGSPLPLPSLLGGTQVFIDGLPAPLLAVASFGGSQQINFVVPWETGYASTAEVTVTNNGVSSLTVVVPVSIALPGLFTTDGTHVAAEHSSDYSAITSANPAKPGETVILYGAGFGPVLPAPLTGYGTPSSPEAMTLIPPSVQIAGLEAQVSFAGLAPGFVALYQLNIVLPAQTPPGEAEVTVAVGTASAKKVKIPVM